MSRIESCFKKLNGRAAFIGYVCAGDPSIDVSEEICYELIRSGVDILELGVPFSDPLADGLTNQLAAQRALESGVTGAEVLDLAKRVRKKFPETPIVFYTYYNLIFSQGERNYVELAKKAGVDGLLTLDMPPEEADVFLPICKENGMDNIFIIAPTTPEDRIQKICSYASGFVYYVSREGVTGERSSLADSIEDKVNLIKKYAKVPVVVGFGISTAEHVRQISNIADGAVVGSALVNCIAKGGESSDIIAAIGAKAKELSSGIV
jgi:tryptophan synthase alpha chain